MPNDQFYDMYEDDGDNKPNAQPEQLRLAGKATIVNINGQQVAVPKIDIVEQLILRISAMEKEMVALKAEIRRNSQNNKQANHVLSRKITSVESELNDRRRL